MVHAQCKPMRKPMQQYTNDDRMTLAGCLAGCSRNFCSTHRFSSRRVVFAGQNLGVRPKISFSLTTSQKAQINCRCHHFQVKPLPACLTLLLSHYRAQTVRNHDIDDHGPQPKGGYNDIPPIQVRLVLQGNESIQSIDQPTNASCVLFAPPWKGTSCGYTGYRDISLTTYPLHAFPLHNFLFTETT